MIAGRLCLVAVAATLVLCAPARAEGPKLPSPTYPSVVTHEVMIAMDDGVKLGATLTFPSKDGKVAAPGKFPVVLSMTPYGRSTPLGATGLESTFGERGIVSAMVDIRGAGGSEGTLKDNYFSPREARDGKDLVEYLGTRDWSTGKVGMTGGSYLGITQYLTAEQQPSHLVAITPIVALSDLYREGWTHGGVPNLFFGAQYLGVQGAPGFAGTTNDPSLAFPTIQAKLGQEPPGFIAFDYLKRPDDDAFYRDRSPMTHVGRIKVPALIFGGWRDGLGRGAPEMFRALAGRRALTRLVIGPCTHKGCGAPFAPETTPDNVDDDSLALFNFLNHYLTGAPLAAAPRAHLFVQGANRYVDSDRYPPRGVRVTTSYLAPSGLAAAAPGARSTQSYFTNPSDGFSMAFDKYGTVAISPYVPTDQQLEAGRGLTWRTGPLAAPLTLMGPIDLHLIAASTATDTDWYAKISDKAPDGTESIVAEGALRASHRTLDPARSTRARPYHTDTNPQPLVPGKPYAFDVEVWPTGYQLAKGHRLQLRLTSDDLPTHLPGRVDFDAANPSLSLFEPLAPATNTVTLGGADPSALRLTTLPDRTTSAILPPARHRCASRRHFVIHLRGAHLRSARVWVAGRRVAVRRRHGRLVAVVDVRGRPKSTIVVRVRARTRSGRVVRDRRRYHLCVPG